MKKEEKDILKRPELRENPFLIPDGYIASFKNKASCSHAPKYSSVSKRVGTYIAVAASIILMALAGIDLIQKLSPSDDYDSIDLLVFSDMSTESGYDLQAMYEEEELTDEEIIEYLIYIGTPIESLESNE